jgi:hypothetical protein
MEWSPFGIKSQQEKTWLQVTLFSKVLPPV